MIHTTPTSTCQDHASGPPTQRQGGTRPISTTPRSSPIDARPIRTNTNPQLNITSRNWYQWIVPPSPPQQQLMPAHHSPTSSLKPRATPPTTTPREDSVNRSHSNPPLPRQRHTFLPVTKDVHVTHHTMEAYATPKTVSILAPQAMTGPTRTTLLSTPVGPPRDEVKPEGTYVIRRNVCQHCDHPLVWKVAGWSSQCQQCASHTTAQFGTPSILGVPHPPLPQSPTTVAINTNINPVTISDYRWASIRIHSTSPHFVTVTSSTQHVAVIPTRIAAFVRTHVAHTLHRAMPHVVNENDIAVTMIQIMKYQPNFISQLTTPPQFPGDHHTFAPADYVPDPGYLRPTTPPTRCGPLHFADPEQSAFFNIEQFRSPLSAVAYSKLSHPLANHIANGIRYGFPMLMRQPVRNRFTFLPKLDGETASRFREVVDKEINIGAFIPTRDWPRHIPRFRSPYFPVVQPNKCRGIAHLSWGKPSVNDLVRRGNLPRVRLGSVVDAVKNILAIQRQHPNEEVQVLKIDVSNAYRQVPLPARDFHKVVHRVHVGDVSSIRQSMGGEPSADHMGITMVAFSDTMAERGVRNVAYVDDVFFMGTKSKLPSEASESREKLTELGFPENMIKRAVDGIPADEHPFLGINVNANTNTVSIPTKRMEKVMQQLDELTMEPTRHQLKSTAGLLQFISTVIPFGKAFIKPLYTAAYSDAPISDQHDTLVHTAKLWKQMLSEFNGKVSFNPPSANTPVLHVSTDASKFGFGIYSPMTKEYAQGEWNGTERRNSRVSHWEAATVLMAAAMFTPQLAGGFLVIHTDSAATVQAYTHQRGRNARLHQLICTLALLQLRTRCRVILQHINGVDNGMADALSRSSTLPPTARHLQRISIPTSWRRDTIGTILRSTQSKLENQVAPSLPKAASICSMHTVEASDTSSQPILPWIPWKLHNQAIEQLLSAGCSISWGTSFSNTPTSSPPTPSASTLVMHPTTGNEESDGSSSGTQSSHSSSTDGDSKPPNDSSEYQQPKTSSDEFWGTQQLTSQSVQQSLSHSIMRCEEANTCHHLVPNTTQISQPSGHASCSFQPKVRTPSSSMVARPKPTTPTPAASGGSRHQHKTLVQPSTLQHGYGSTLHERRTTTTTPRINLCLSKPTEGSSQGKTFREHSRNTLKMPVYQSNASPSTHYGLVHCSRWRTRAYHGKPSLRSRAGRPQVHHL